MHVEEFLDNAGGDITATLPFNVPQLRNVTRVLGSIGEHIIFLGEPTAAYYQHASGQLIVAGAPIDSALLAFK